MSNYRMPIIKMEIENMRHSMLVALSEYKVQCDEYLQEAVTKFCSPEQLKRIIGETVESEMASVIETEVRNFFRYGAGRDAIKRAVVAKLEEKLEADDTES